MPPANKETLLYICQFLADVGRYSGINQMDNANLAMVMAPNLLRDPSSDAEMFARNSENEARAIQLIITMCSDGSLRSDQYFEDA